MTDIKRKPSMMDIARANDAKMAEANYKAVLAKYEATKAAKYANYLNPKAVIRKTVAPIKSTVPVTKSKTIIKSFL